MSEFVSKSQLQEKLESLKAALETLAATLERIAFERDSERARAEKAEARADHEAKSYDSLCVTVADLTQRVANLTARAERLAEECEKLWAFVKARDDRRAANKQYLNHEIREDERLEVSRREDDARSVLSEIWSAKQDAHGDLTGGGE